MFFPLIFLLGWQLLVLLLRCSSFCSFYLLPAILFVIVYLLSFWFLLFGPWMFSLVRFRCAFFSFCTLTFVGFLLSKDAIFFYFIFFLTTSDSHRTLLLTVGLVGMHSAAASMWTMTKFSYSSFRVSISVISWGVSNLFLKVTLYLLLTSLLNEEQSSHLIVPSAQISLTLSCHPSLLFITSGRFSRLHPVSSQCYCM